MEGQAPAHQDVIQHDGELFASGDHLGQILGLSSGSSSQLVRVHEGRIFFSVIRVNDLLASFTTEQLEVVARPKEQASHGSLALGLVDGRGEEVQTLDALRHEEWALHSSTSSEDEQQPGINSDPGSSWKGNCGVARHDTPFDSEYPQGQLDQRSKDSLPHAQHSDNYNNIEDVGETDDLFMRPTTLPIRQPSMLRKEQPSSESATDGAQINLTHRAPQYDEAVVRKLRDLKLNDLTTLARLLENRAPLALGPPPKTRDELVHLCTVDDGTIFSIRMFRDLHAHNERLEFANLNDPELLDRPLTGYQKNQLSMILLDIEKTDCAQQLWSSRYSVPLTRRNDYNRIIPKPRGMRRKLYYKYENMADFKNEVELLVENVERFHGSVHEVTAAAERTVREIAARMDDAAAVGIDDTKESLFHGLIREVSLAEGTPLPFKDSPSGRMPQFVLPLGRLHTSQSHIEPPAAHDAIILMDVSNPRKAIWMYHSDTEGSYLAMLADNITRWKLSSSPGRNDGGLTKRTELDKEYQESRIDLPPGAVVHFKRAYTTELAQTRLAQTIKEGWGWGAAPPEGQVTPRRRFGPPSQRSVAKSTRKRVYVFLGSEDDEEEVRVPATAHRKSKKTITPKGGQRRAKAPRTV